MQENQWPRNPVLTFWQSKRICSDNAPDGMADDLWREAVALKRYWFHPMMLIGDEPQSYLSYRDIAPGGVVRRP
jgi:hypothetical protein